MKLVELNDSQLKKIFIYVSPMVTYILALFSGLWWLNDDLLRGVIYLIGLYVYSYHTGYRGFFNTKRYYFYFTFAIPTVIATVLFSIGFIVR